MFKRFLLFPFILVCLFFVGCGDGSVPSSGTINFQSGEPVPSGVIFFESPQYSYRGDIRDGTFQIEGLTRGSGLPPGTYAVSVSGSVAGSDPATDEPLFNEKYSDPRTSGIVVEVVKGQPNVFEIKVGRAR